MASWPFPRWIAHRGAGRLAPENTLAAFRTGAAHGYRAFECDVKLSADGVPFLLHDATLERTTNGCGMAGEHDWAALSRLDAGRWHSAQFAGEPLPTFEGVARYCMANDFALNVEIKPTPGEEGETGKVIADLAAQWWAHALQRPLLSSFRPNALAAAKAAQPALPRALLLDALRDGWLEEARLLDCVAIVAHHKLFDARVVERIRQAGLHAMAYTVNDAHEATRLWNLGLSALITDAVDSFAPV